MKLTPKKISIFLFAVLLGAFSFNFIQPAFAANDICSNNDLAEEVKDAAGCNGNANKLPNTVINILNAIIGVIGIAAVVFVVIGGITYMTSAGDAGKTKKAKDTILYATIGLVICALAFAIVNFVISDILPKPDASSYNSKGDCKKAGYEWKNNKCQ